MSTSEFRSVVSEFFDVQGWSTTATLIKTTSTYNPATSESIVTESRFTMQAIPFDYINKFQGASQQTGTLIRSGDKQVFLKPIPSVIDIDPTADKLQIGSKVYDIITVKECNPTLTDSLYWELFVRI